MIAGGEWDREPPPFMTHGLEKRGVRHGLVDDGVLRYEGGDHDHRNAQAKAVEIKIIPFSVEEKVRRSGDVGRLDLIVPVTARRTHVIIAAAVLIEGDYEQRVVPMVRRSKDSVVDFPDEEFAQHHRASFLRPIDSFIGRRRVHVVMRVEEIRFDEGVRRQRSAGTVVFESLQRVEHIFEYIGTIDKR